MIRLVTICLVTSTVRIQVAGNLQAGPSGGESSPLYNLVASSFLNKCPLLNNTAGDPGPFTCTCGFCNEKSPVIGPPSVLSGMVVFPSSELQHILRAPVPVPLYAPSPHIPSSPPPSPFYYTPPSSQPSPPSTYIMSIPRKKETPPSKAVQETSPYPPNSMYASPSTLPPTQPPRSFYYTPKSPFMASCPATFYFPTTQANSFNEPSIYTFAPKVNPFSPSYPSGPTTYPYPIAKPNFSNPEGAVTPPSTTPAKDPLVTYTLRAAGQPDVLPGTSLEAESKDCSMPTPPVLI